MTAPFVAWAAYFLALYAVLSVACVAGLDSTGIVIALAALTAGALAAIVWLGWHGLRTWRAAAGADGAPRGFIGLTAALCAGLALVATVWVAAPMLLLPTCA